MFASIASAIAGPLVNALIAPFVTIFTAYINKQITIEQLRAQMTEALLTAFAEVEKSHADALAKTYDSFMQAASKNATMTRVWAAVTLSQLVVLLWHQMGIPAIVALGLVEKYPSSGGTVDWAYALVGACVGFGPLVLRTGPGGPNLAALKSVIS